jgi:hypothetical protein
MSCIIAKASLYVGSEPSRFVTCLIWTFVMNIIAPQSPPVSALNSDEAREPASEAASDLPDFITEPLVERDCLCGTFTARDGPFAMNAVRSRW